MLILEAIVDAAVARLVAADFLGGNVEKHRDPPSKDDRLPLANVTYDTDRANADGGPRTGRADFVHKFSLVVDIIDTGSTGAATMAKLAAHSERVMEVLVPYVHNLHPAIEGVDGVNHLTEKSPEGGRIVYRRQVQIEILYRSQWEPSAADLDDFESVGVNVGNGIGADIEVPTA